MLEIALFYSNVCVVVYPADLRTVMASRQKKTLYFQKLHQILEEYTKMFVVEIKHVTSKQVADIRKSSAVRQEDHDPLLHAYVRGAASWPSY